MVLLLFKYMEVSKLLCLYLYFQFRLEPAPVRMSLLDPLTGSFNEGSLSVGETLFLESPTG